jgi:hypothetical protein
MTKTEEKRCAQLDHVEDMLYNIRQSVWSGGTANIARGLKRLRNYLNKEFPVEKKAAKEGGDHADV